LTVLSSRGHPEICVAATAIGKIVKPDDSPHEGIVSQPGIQVRDPGRLGGATSVLIDRADLRDDHWLGVSTCQIAEDAVVQRFEALPGLIPPTVPIVPAQANPINIGVSGIVVVHAIPVFVRVAGIVRRPHPFDVGGAYLAEDIPDAAEHDSIGPCVQSILCRPPSHIADVHLMCEPEDDPLRPRFQSARIAANIPITTTAVDGAQRPLLITITQVASRAVRGGFPG